MLGSFRICMLYEENIELIDVDQTDAVTLVSAIRESYEQINLTLDKCYGQVYDGAFNMASHLTVIVACILKVAPKTQYVH